MKQCWSARHAFYSAQRVPIRWVPYNDVAYFTSITILARLRGAFGSIHTATTLPTSNVPRACVGKVKTLSTSYVSIPGTRISRPMDTIVKTELRPGGGPSLCFGKRMIVASL